MRRARHWGLSALVLLGAAAAGAIAACSTVDLGTAPADLNACRPSELFFVSEIWPNVLAQDYSGKHCYDAACHDTGRGLPLTLVVPGPSDSSAVPLAGVWGANYISVTEQMNCSDASASFLVMMPTNTLTHGGGMLFSTVSDQARAIEMWPSVKP